MIYEGTINKEAALIDLEGRRFAYLPVHTYEIVRVAGKGIVGAIEVPGGHYVDLRWKPILKGDAYTVTREPERLF